MVITEQQREERVNYIGASECAAVLGLSRYGSPLQVWMAKTHPSPDISEVRIGGKNEAAYWGNELEDKVAENFTKVTGKKVYRVNDTKTHPEYDFIRVNLDRQVYNEDATLECKTCSAWKAGEWEADEIPEEYILQVMHGLAVTGKKYGYIAVLIGGQKFLWKCVERDEELIAKIIAAEVDFWERFVLTKTPPMPTGSDRDSSLLGRLYPTANPELDIELPAEIEAIIARRAELITMGDDLDEKILEVENIIKARMGEAESARAGIYRVTWKGQTRTSIDSALLKEKWPKTFAAVQKAKSFRVLRIAKNKEAE